MHKISFTYSSKEDVLSHLSLDRARQMMARSSSVAVHDDGIDVYYLPTLVPLYMENDLGWVDHFADMLVWVIEEPSR